MFSPRVINDTFESLKKAQRKGLEWCIGEVDYIEIYIKLIVHERGMGMFLQDAALFWQKRLVL